jgi:hypothetical protein
VSRMLPRDHGGVHACAGVMSGIQRCIRGPRYGSCMMGGHMQPGQRGAQARRGPPSLLLATCGVGYWWTRPKASAPLGPPSASPTNGAVRLAPPGQLPGRAGRGGSTAGGSVHHGARAAGLDIFPKRWVSKVELRLGPSDRSCTLSCIRESKHRSIMQHVWRLRSHDQRKAQGPSRSI